jgi:hypothetical protein
VAETERPHQRFDNRVMRDWFMGSGCFGNGNLRQFRSPDFGERPGDKSSTHGFLLSFG